MAGVYTTKRTIMAIDQSGADTSQPICTVVAADVEVAAMVIAADPTSDNGRSPWLWVRLQNGDLMLGCFPQAHTYFACEADPNAF